MWPFCWELWSLELLNVWSIRLLESTRCWLVSFFGGCSWFVSISSWHFLEQLPCLERSYLVDEFNLFINLYIPPCYSPRVNRGSMVGAFECLKLSVGIRLSYWCHSGSTGMCCLCVRSHFAQVTDCCTMVLNHICFCMGDSWVYIPSGSRSDCWKH